MGHGHLLHLFENAGGGKAGIDAHGHRRGAGVGFLAGQRHFQPPQALAMGDNADLFAFRLQDRTLFDVIFEIGVHFARAHLFLAQPADAFQLFAIGLAVGIGAAIGIIEIVNAGEDAGGQHGRGKARAFLV